MHFSTAKLGIIRFMLSLAKMIHFRLGCIEIKSDLLQSGPINISIYVRPSELSEQRGIIGLLTNYHTE